MTAKPGDLVSSWLADCTTRVNNPRVKATTKQCWASFLAYCLGRGAHPIGAKQFSRILREKIGAAPERDKHGALFPRLIIAEHGSIDARRRA